MAYLPCLLLYYALSCLKNMHRQALLCLIQNYRGCYPAETETINRLVSFIKANSKCFDRHLESGHITGSAWLVNKNGSAVLMTHHRKLNRWLQLGGHAESCSDIKAVAMREAYEESGLKEIKVISEEIFDIDIHLIPERKHEKAHYHYDIRFALQSVGSESYTVSEESKALSWVSIADLASITVEESIIRMKRKWLSSETGR